MHWIARYSAALLLIVGPALLVQAEEIVEEKVRKQLLQLKKFCDEGLIDAEVCKEKQRHILGLPPTVPISVEALSKNSDEEQPLKTERGFLGVVVEPISSKTGAEPHLAAGEGAAVFRVLEDSPAERAGVKPGDVIVKLGDQVLRSADLFAEIEAALTPGTKLPLKVLSSAGEEKVLYATIIDQRKYPPARRHTSSLGFSITLPAGWKVIRNTDLDSSFDLFTRHLEKNPRTSTILNYTKKLAEFMEFYARGSTFISAVNHNMALPTTPSASQEMCARLAANRSKTANSQIRVHDCSLRTIIGSLAFCMDQDARLQNQKMKHCWIKRPSQGNLKLTLTYNKKFETSSINDF